MNQISNTHFCMKYRAQETHTDCTEFQRFSYLQTNQLNLYLYASVSRTESISPQYFFSFVDDTHKNTNKTVIFLYQSYKRVSSFVSWCSEPSQPQMTTIRAEHKLQSIAKLVVPQVIIPQVFSSPTTSTKV